MRPRLLALTLFTALAWLASPFAGAHTLSTSYLRIDSEPQRVTTRIVWDIALKDLHEALDLDLDGDGRVRWREVEESRSRIVAYANSRLTVGRGGAPCRAGGVDLEYDEHGDGGYVVLAFAEECASSTATLTVDYRLLFDLDPSHRGLLHVGQGDSVVTAVLSPTLTHWTMPDAEGSWLATFAAFIGEGVAHIWTGYDHLAFLLLLLLPTVLARNLRSTPRAALLSVIKVVTAFTVAHSITLALAVTQVVVPPEKPVEVAIALSVVAAGLLNLAPQLAAHGWRIAFVFGLLHGFGFANALRTLTLSGGALAAPLAGFNLGVELGQLAVVAVALPLLYGWAHRDAYRQKCVPAVSVAIAALAAVWAVERW
jgi:hypothetical protein